MDEDNLPISILDEPETTVTHSPSNDTFWHGIPIFYQGVPTSTLSTQRCLVLFLNGATTMTVLNFPEGFLVLLSLDFLILFSPHPYSPFLLLLTH